MGKAVPIEIPSDYSREGGKYFFLFPRHCMLLFCVPALFPHRSMLCCSAFSCVFASYGCPATSAWDAKIWIRIGGLPYYQKCYFRVYFVYFVCFSVLIACGVFLPSVIDLAEGSEH